MKILFDECMPQPLRRRLAEFEISTAQKMGWGRVKNGELLKRAEGVFDAFLTADQATQVSAKSDRPAAGDSGAFNEPLAKGESQDAGNHRGHSSVAGGRLCGIDFVRASVPGIEHFCRAICAFSRPA